MNAQKVFLGLALMCAAGVTVLAEPRRSRGNNEVAESDDSDRSGKLLNIFQVVRFQNEACNTTANDQGVCYTAAECTSRDGTNSGTCAGGFGVCCSFSVNCGATTNQNNTYFSSSDTDVSPCTVKVCPCSDEVCQIRLDFETFNIAQPLAPPVVVPDPNMFNAGTTCQSATFAATSTSTNVPLICGTNTGQHIYLGADMACNELTFNWQMGSTPRDWRIKISQIKCSDLGLPPAGCLQYYTENTGFIMSFNFAGGRHLANQEQTICIRTMNGACQIDYSDAGLMSFSLSKTTNPMNSFQKNMGDFCTSDYLYIPLAFGDDSSITTDKLCGSVLIEPGANTLGGPVSSREVPFLVSFITDAGEGGLSVLAQQNRDDNNSGGFKVAYKQCCPAVGADLNC